MPHAAIVTLAVGEPCRSRWEKYARDAWVAYAQKCGMDLIAVHDPLDVSPRGRLRSISWQKCLVLSQDWAARYDRIVLIDCDIVVNAGDAPNILDQVGPEYVGGVISCSQIHEDLRPMLRGKRWPYERADRQWLEDQNYIYSLQGLGPRPEGIIQGGVLVASPASHRDLFRGVYAAPRKNDTSCHEQLALSQALLGQGLFRQIDTRFNSVFHDTAMVFYPFLLQPNRPPDTALLRTMVRIQLTNNFFLHFAATADWMKYVVE